MAESSNGAIAGGWHSGDSFAPGGRFGGIGPHGPAGTPPFGPFVRPRRRFRLAHRINWALEWCVEDPLEHRKGQARTGRIGHGHGPGADLGSRNHAVEYARSRDSCPSRNAGCIPAGRRPDGQRPGTPNRGGSQLRRVRASDFALFWNCLAGRWEDFDHIPVLGRLQRPKPARERVRAGGNRRRDAHGDEAAQWCCATRRS